MSVQFSALTQCTMGEFGSSSLEVGVRANSAPPPVYPTSPLLAVLLPRHGKGSSGVTLDLPSTQPEPRRSPACDEQVHMCPSPWGVPGPLLSQRLGPLWESLLSSVMEGAWAGEGGSKMGVISRGLATRICWPQSPYCYSVLGPDVPSFRPSRTPASMHLTLRGSH